MKCATNWQALKHNPMLKQFIEREVHKQARDIAFRTTLTWMRCMMNRGLSARTITACLKDVPMMTARWGELAKDGVADRVFVRELEQYGVQGLYIPDDEM